MRTPDRAQLVGMFARIRGGPPDDLADLGLAVAVQHDDTELVGKTARLERRERRGDAAHVSQRRKVDDGRIIGQHRHRRGRKHRRPDAEPGDQLGEHARIEPVHDDDLGSGPQPEEHVVDAGIERERNRDEIRCGTPCRRGATQRSENAVEQLQVVGVRVQDRLR